jgi:hypothetical protein
VRWRWNIYIILNNRCSKLKNIKDKTDHRETMIRMTGFGVYEMTIFAPVVWPSCDEMDSIDLR